MTPLQTFAGAPHAIDAIAMSPDASQLAVGSATGVATFAPETATHRWASVETPQNLAYSPDGASLAVAGIASAVLDAHSGQRRWSLNAMCAGVAWSPDGARVVFGSRGLAYNIHPTAHSFEAATGAPQWSQKRIRYDGGIAGVGFACDGSWVAITDREQVTFLKPSTGESRFENFPNSYMLHAIAWDPVDPKRLAVGGYQEAYVWTITPDGDWTTLVLPHPKHVKTLSWSPDGRRLLTGGDDGQCRLWELAAQQVLLELPGQVAAWSTDGRRIVTGDREGRVRVFDATTII